MDLAKARREFPALDGPAPVRYFDHACVTLKPRPVLAAMQEYYETNGACAGRSTHRLGALATKAVSDARETVANFVNTSAQNVAFTANCTQAIHAVAHGLGLGRDDVVVTTNKEHNSNFAPWAAGSRGSGPRHAIFNLNLDGTWDLEAFQDFLAEVQGVALVSTAHVSNVDGVTVDAREITRIAHDAGARILLDGAQAGGHQRVDLAAIGCDFYALSLHKMYGPSGTGALTGSAEALEQLTPAIMGGHTLDGYVDGAPQWSARPARFEAGLQNVAGILGAAAACRFLSEVGIERVAAHEREMNAKLDRGIRHLPGVSIHGPSVEKRGGITGFTVAAADGQDVASYLDEAARVAVRSGQHCAHPWFDARGQWGSIRSSVGMTTTPDEVNAFCEALEELTAAL